MGNFRTIGWVENGKGVATRCGCPLTIDVSFRKNKRLYVYSGRHKNSLISNYERKLGKNRIKSGYMMKIKISTISMTRNHRIPRNTCEVVTKSPTTLLTTNTFMPTGGVTMPISSSLVSTTPNQ